MASALAARVAILAERGIRRVAITWVNHAGAPLVKVVPLSRFESAVEQGVGFSAVSDAFRVDDAIDPAHGLARPDGDLRLRAVASSLAPLEPASGWAWACGERFEREGSPYPAHQRIACRQQQLELTLLPGLIYRQRALGTASQSRLFRARLMVAKSSPSP